MSDLVKRVADALEAAYADSPTFEYDARVAIRAIADELEKEGATMHDGGALAVACWLREQAKEAE